MLGGKTSPSPSEQDNSLWPCLLVAVCKAILCRPVTFLHLIHRFSLSALIFQAPWSTAQAQAIAQGPKVYPLGARLGRARPLLQCRYAIWTGLRSALLRRCGLRRELCCCRSSRRISDSYFLLEMLGSAAPKIFRIKRSRFIPLPACFRCWDGLVFTLSLPAFSGWRLCSGKVCQCCPRTVSSHAGKMLGRG